MKIKSMMVAALAVLTFASCTKDNNEGGSKKPLDGANAKMNISFILPSNNTRAGEQNASTEESAVKTIDVFVFGQDADAGAVATGAYSRFTSGQFEKNVSDKWTLKAGNEIETVAGDVTIYVALNLPATYSKQYGNKTLFLAAIAQAAELCEADKGFTMFNAGSDSSLKPVTDNATDDYVNSVSMVMDRVVSKVVASTTAQKYNKSWYAGTADEIQFEYVIKHFNVFNEAVKTYLAPNASTLVNSSTTGVINTFAASSAKTAVNMGLNPADEAGRTAMKGFYIGENTPEEAANGNTTYAMVSTTLQLNKAAEWDATGKKHVYKPIAGGYGAGVADSDIFIVKHKGITFVTDTKTKASAIVNGLKELHEETVATAKIYTYKDGYVHFQVWLRKEGANDYRIGRNEFIHLQVSNVKLIDGIFPGYPGTPTDPKKPIDPTDPEDPENPDPEDPDKPVDPEKATLNVLIEVNPWNYKPANVELS